MLECILYSNFRLRGLENEAVTYFSPLTVINVVNSLPLASPPQFEKSQPESGNAVRVIDSPLSNCYSPLDIVIFSISPTEYPI